MDKIVEFCLPGIDERGEQIELCILDFLGKGKDIIIYFYPKDNTQGCTLEATDFRNNMEHLRERAYVIGISPDSIESHKKFMKKHGLNFYLLSDPDFSVISSYNAYGEKNMYGKKVKGVMRTTYIFDQNGALKKVWKNVKAKGHVQEIVEFYERK